MKGDKSGYRRTKGDKHGEKGIQVEKRVQRFRVKGIKVEKRRFR